MISQYLTSMEGIAVPGMLALLLSLAAFLAIAVWALRAKPSYITSMERLPLDDSPEHWHEEER
jgi:hypothetical protein